MALIVGGVLYHFFLMLAQAFLQVYNKRPS